MRRLRNGSKVFTLLAVLALVAAACGDDDAETPTTTAPPAAPTTTEAPAPTTTEGPAPTTMAPTTMAPTTTEIMEPEGVSCDEPVTIGVISDLSGALAIYGAHIQRGVPIGFAWATDSPVPGPGAAGEQQTYALDDCELRVLFRDDQTNPELSATAARELIEVEGADILIGTVSSGVTATLQEIARENDVILVAAPAAANDLTGSTFNPNTFRASRNNYQDAMAICEQLTKEFDTFVQIAPDYSFGYGGAQAYRDACTFFGGQFTADDVFAPADTTDFTSYMETIDDAQAEAFLITWAGGGFVPLLQAATDLGVLEDKVIASPFVDNIVMPAFFSNAIGTTSTILYHYTLPDNPANDFLIEQVQAMGTFPDLFDADGMNAAIMVVEALRETGGAADADSLRDALEGLSFEGPKGLIEIRPEDHVALQDMYIVTLLNVDDPEFEYYEHVDTVRPQPPCLLEGDFLDRCGDLPAGSLTG